MILRSGERNKRPTNIFMRIRNQFIEKRIKDCVAMNGNEPRGGETQSTSNNNSL